MKKNIAYIAIIAAFILVTFFGLGPVIFADGGSGERFSTLLVVLLLYAILVVLYRLARNKLK
jgi:hypothetical protein